MDFKVFLSLEALTGLEKVVAYIAPHNPAAAPRAITGRAFPPRTRLTEDVTAANVH